MPSPSLGARAVPHLAGLVGLTLLCGPAAAAPPVDPTGTWLTEDGRARVRVEHCGAKQEQVCGFVVWLKSPTDDGGRPRTDQFNPDDKRKPRLALGHQMILGLKPNSEARYEGQIYNADNGKKYDITLWREQSGGLHVKGCMLSVFCGSQTWSRVTDVAAGQLTGATGSADGPKADPEWAQDRTAGRLPAAKAPK
ncbi:hypothetical protein OPKNFCMD_0578 [Methylobacterium crusticola]|uniref:DUF2147 domain-containing protein n=1 Tax=Methylobacterium crusticola TaxID=1697972 RepID=A0ABQ4QRD3_9HYPH|nr:DUF2147 domain-containing protein [Methylobacterium crusticola]GJD47866.1 hypothetical protein OPKNFCMD_0578 [Methylobacterium crusticola]